MAESNTIPTKIELSAESLFAETQERRSAAKRLLAQGAFREATREELEREFHPYFIAQRYQGRLEDSPAGRKILEIVAAQPVEISPKEQDSDADFDEIVKRAYPEKPAKPPAPVVPPPAQESALPTALETGAVPQGPVIRKPQVMARPSWEQPNTDQMPIDW
jgi:hypothetical protein